MTVIQPSFHKQKARDPDQEQHHGSHKTESEDPSNDDLTGTNWLGDHGINRAILDVGREAESRNQQSKKPQQQLGAKVDKPDVNLIGMPTVGIENCSAMLISLSQARSARYSRAR